LSVVRASIRANSLVSNYGSNLYTQIGGAALQGGGTGLSQGFHIGTDGNLHFDTERAVTGGIAGGLGTYATSGMTNRLTSSVVTGTATTAGNLAYNQWEKGNWDMADTLRTGAIDTVAGYAAGQMTDQYIAPNGNTAYTNQIVTGMGSHFMSQGIEAGKVGNGRPTFIFLCRKE
jgi:hypothetical protein